MSKRRKQPSKAATSPSPQSPTNSPTPACFSPHNVIFQLIAILALSTVLGFTFNSANPVGVKFNSPAASPSIAMSQTDSSVDSLIEKNSDSAPSPVPPKPWRSNSNVQLAAQSPAPQATPAPVPTQPTTKSVATKSQPPSPHSHNHAPTPVSSTNNPANPSPIHWPEAKELVATGRAVLVDVRHKALYDAGHIPGAISLPEMSMPDDFKKFLDQQPEGRIVILYCSSTSCSQSARVAARFVNEFHYPAVRYMTGGYAEYQQAELVKPAPVAP